MMPNWLNKLLLALFCIFYFVAFPYGVYLAASNWYNFYTCHFTSAGVVKSIEIDNYRKEYKITFSFSLPDGTERESLQKVRMSEPKYGIGDKVRVRYKSGYAALDDAELIYPDVTALPMMTIMGFPYYIIIYVCIGGLWRYIYYYIKYYIKGDT